MTDGIRTGDVHSYGTHGLYIKTRNISLPEKKSIRQTIPFMNGYYDFSALNGAPAWDERKIDYSFDATEDTPAALDEKVSEVMDWLGNIHDEDIFDDTVLGFHFHGSYESSSIKWDENGLKAEISVTFVCHPFKIANYDTSLTLPTGEHVVHNSGMAVIPFASCASAAAIQIGNYATSIPAGENIQLTVTLERGKNNVLVSGDSPVILKFRKEVL